MTEPLWLTEAEVLAAHQAQVEDHGGAHGVRDIGQLQSAIFPPQHRFNYETPSLYDLAASYAFGLARNHPFIDGNKRTAFIACYAFLRINGIRLIADEGDVVRVFVDLAAGALDENALAKWIETNTESVEHS